MRIGFLVALVGAFCWASAVPGAPAIAAAPKTAAAFRKSRLDMSASNPSGWDGIYHARLLMARAGPPGPGRLGIDCAGYSSRETRSPVMNPRIFVLTAALSVGAALGAWAQPSSVPPISFPVTQGKTYKFEKIADGVYYAS